MRKYQARFGGGLLEKDQSRDWHLAGSLPYYTPSGKAVTHFRVAVNRLTSNGDGEHGEATDWFSVVTWEKLAEMCNQYLERGSKVYVEGRLQTRSWEGEDGQKRYLTEVVASEVIMLDRRGQDSVEAEPAEEETEVAEPPPANTPPKRNGRTRALVGSRK